MELEQAKALWIRDRALMQSGVPGAAHIAADTRSKVEERDRRFGREQARQLALGAVCMLLLAAQFHPRMPVLSGLGLAVMIGAGSAALCSHLRLRRRYRMSRPELPAREYLTEQRDKARHRLRVLRGNLCLLIFACLPGFLLWRLSPAPPAAQALVSVALAAAASAVAVGLYRRTLTAEILPLLADIDRELAGMDGS